MRDYVISFVVLVNYESLLCLVALLYLHKFERENQSIKERYVLRPKANPKKMSVYLSCGLTNSTYEGASTKCPWLEDF